MTHDEILRAILATESLAALLLSGAYFGSIWPERGRPARIIIVGLCGVLLYVFAGQIKAFNLNVPVDGVTAIGMVSYTVLLAGLLLFMRHERTRRRGR